MRSDGSRDVKYSPLDSGGSGPGSPRGTPPCCCGTPRVSVYKQAVLVLTVVAVLVLVGYQGVWHTSQPPDVWGGLADDLPPTASRDEVWDKIRIKHTKRRLPQCLIIGIRKGGTRALLTFLNLHPQIQTAKNEVHFFDEDDAYHRGYDWYRKRMPYSFPGQITLEKSPAYFKSKEAPERVHKMNATIKLLLIVRDPTERAISDYLQLHIKRLSKGKPSEKFEVLAMTPEGEVDETYAAVRLSLYYKHMRNWLKYFKLEQFHIVDGDNMVKNPLQELKQVERFLGIEHRLGNDMFYYNRTRGFYCFKQSYETRCLDQTKGRKHPDVDPTVIHKLRKYFKPYNERFFEMVGRRFKWPVE